MHRRILWSRPLGHHCHTITTQCMSRDPISSTRLHRQRFSFYSEKLEVTAVVVNYSHFRRGSGIEEKNKVDVLPRVEIKYLYWVWACSIQKAIISRYISIYVTAIMYINPRPIDLVLVIGRRLVITFTLTPDQERSGPSPKNEEGPDLQTGACFSVQSKRLKE